jgi:hypothetical protein
MGTFRRVEGEHAGPDALGILVPPGRRTFVILRPRALPWDLLLCRGPAELVFRDLAHDEASAAAQALYRALRAWTAGGPGAVEAVETSEGHRVRVVLDPFALVACAREPGRPYVPFTATASEAALAAARITAALCPGEGAEKELYFNVRYFERSNGR